MRACVNTCLVLNSVIYPQLHMYVRYSLYLSCTHVCMYAPTICTICVYRTYVHSHVGVSSPKVSHTYVSLLYVSHIYYMYLCVYVYTVCTSTYIRTFAYNMYVCIYLHAVCMSGSLHITLL